ncbi:MAG: DUF488 domain-containing protein [Gemmataceae bacterium]|nr:DUF488 domain-containing protein [Gemmataceae bacterium]
MNDNTLFTVGHSNYDMVTFIALLKQHAIDVLTDVRSSPYSKYVPHFNKANLEREIRAAGMQYLYLGQHLGGMPDNDAYYDDDGRVLYYRVAKDAGFLHAISRLEQGIKKYVVAIMCGEENPSGCHRHLLVSRVMSERGTHVLHLRGDGSVQTDVELHGSICEQPFLFDLPDEDITWKSM